MQSDALKKSIWLGVQDVEGDIKGGEETDACLRHRMRGVPGGRSGGGVGGCCHPHQAGVSAFSPHSW